MLARAPTMPSLIPGGTEVFAVEQLLTEPIFQRMILAAPWTRYAPPASHLKVAHAGAHPLSRLPPSENQQPGSASTATETETDDSAIAQPASSSSSSSVESNIGAGTRTGTGALSPIGGTAQTGTGSTGTGSTGTGSTGTGTGAGTGSSIGSGSSSGSSTGAGASPIIDTGITPRSGTRNVEDDNDVDESGVVLTPVPIDVSDNNNDDDDDSDGDGDDGESNVRSPLDNNSDGGDGETSDIADVDVSAGGDAVTRATDENTVIATADHNDDNEAGKDEAGGDDDAAAAAAAADSASGSDNDADDDDNDDNNNDVNTDTATAADTGTVAARASASASSKDPAFIEIASIITQSSKQPSSSSSSSTPYPRPTTLATTTSLSPTSGNNGDDNNSANDGNTARVTPTTLDADRDAQIANITMSFDQLLSWSLARAVMMQMHLPYRPLYHARSPLQGSSVSYLGISNKHLEDPDALFTRIQSMFAGRRRNRPFVCLNDAIEGDAPLDYADRFADTFETMFPTPAPWELDSEQRKGPAAAGGNRKPTSEQALPVVDDNGDNGDGGDDEPHDADGNVEPSSVEAEAEGGNDGDAADAGADAATAGTEPDVAVM